MWYSAAPFLSMWRIAHAVCLVFSLPALAGDSLAALEASAYSLPPALSAPFLIRLAGQTPGHEKKRRC